MLMVSTTESMVDWVHGNWSDAREHVPLGLVLVPLDTSLQNRLVDSSTASHDSDHGSAFGWDGLSVATGESDSHLVAFLGPSYDDGGGAGASCELALVVEFAFDVAHDCAVWDLRERQHIADGEGRLLAHIDVLAGVHAFSGDEELSAVLIVVGVTEDDLGERSPAAWVVDDLLDDTTEVSRQVRMVALPFTFGEVEVPELCWSHSPDGVGLKDASLALSLYYAMLSPGQQTFNNFSHKFTYL